MVFCDELRKEVESKIRSIPDFPIAGINFRDIMPLFAYPALVDKLCRAIAEHAKTVDGGIEAVAGLEARGFLFGPQIASYLNVPFVPIRKKGKLPGECIQASYIKEYGEEIVEIQKDVIKPGQRVMIIDDLLATGGTLKAALQIMVVIFSQLASPSNHNVYVYAAVDVLKKAGGVPVEAVVLIELASLNGRSKISDHTAVTALISYATE